MDYAGIMQGVLKYTAMDEIEAAVNLLTPCTCYLGCYVVTVLTGTLDPVTALVTGILMSGVDACIGTFSNTYFEPSRNMKDGSFGYISMFVIPLVVVSVLGTPLSTSMVYVVIAVASRTFILYQAGTFWFNLQPQNI